MITRLQTLTDDLQEKLKSELLEISRDTNESILQKAIKSAKAVKNSINELKAFIYTYTFANTQEEIIFFKHTQPSLYAQFLYYNRLAQIEIKTSASSKEEQQTLYRSELGGIQTFFEKHHDFYTYYRLESDFWDEQYFLRKYSDIEILTPSESLLWDAYFSTKKSYIMACVRYNELLKAYVLEQLEQLENVTFRKNPSLHWIAHKVQLAELIYALAAYGAFGKVATKAIAEAIFQQWGSPNNSFYKTFDEIRYRKKNPTAFLDELKVSLLRQMELDNKKPRK